MSNGDARISNVAHFFLSDVKSETADADIQPDVQDKKISNESEVVRPTSGISRISPSGQKFTPQILQEQTNQFSSAGSSDFLDASVEKIGEMVDEIVNEIDDEIVDDIDEVVGEIDECFEGECGEDQLYVIGVLADHLKVGVDSGLDQFAKSLADGDQRVGVLTADAQRVMLRLVASESADLKALINDFSADDLFGRLNVLAGSLDYLLVNLNADFTKSSQNDIGIYDYLSSVCVLASPQRDDMVGAYQILKTFSQRDIAGGSAGMFIVDTSDFSQANKVLTKVTETAKKHLNLEIENFGYAIDNDGVAVTIIAGGQFGDDQNVLKQLSNWLAERNGEADSNFDDLNIEPVEMSEADQNDNDDLNLNFDLDDEKSSTVKPSELIAGKTVKVDEADDSDDDIVVIENAADADDQVKLAEIVGEKLLTCDRAVKDQLDGFLRSAGVDCARFESCENLDNIDQTATLVLLLRAGDDIDILDWVLAHYPKANNKLLIVSDRQLGAMERSRFSQHFTQVDIRRMMRGKLGGKDVLIIHRN